MLFIARTSALTKKTKPKVYASMHMLHRLEAEKIKKESQYMIKMSVDLFVCTGFVLRAVGRLASSHSDDGSLGNL